MKQEIEDVIGLDASEAVHASAKAGIGIKEIIEQICEKVPAPQGNPDNPLKALIFDSHYDSYKGVIVYVRVVDGSIKAGSKIKMMATNKVFEVIEVGAFKPRMSSVPSLEVGDVGFIVAGIKNVGDTRVGDTVTEAERPAPEALPGYRRINPMVFCGLYPIETTDYNDLREALQKLELNDASLRFEPETSTALRLWLPLRILGTAAHGNYSGAD